MNYQVPYIGASVIFWCLRVPAGRKRGGLALNLMRPHQIMQTSRPYLFNTQTMGWEADLDRSSPSIVSLQHVFQSHFNLPFICRWLMNFYLHSFPLTQVLLLNLQLSTGYIHGCVLSSFQIRYIQNRIICIHCRPAPTTSSPFSNISQFTETYNPSTKIQTINVMFL